MTVTNPLARQLSRSTVFLTWTSEALPVAGFDISRTAVETGTIQIAVVNGQFRDFEDGTVDKLDIGAEVQYHVIDLDEATGADAPVITLVDADLPYTYGPVNALQTVPRYTTVAEVKARMGIPAADVTKDALLEQSVVAAEVQIDQINGRSFPDSGLNPQWAGVPDPIRAWATDAAIAVYKRAETPFGQAGSDNWIGTLDVQDEVERALRRNPLALGYKVSWGIGFRAAN